MKNVSFRRAAAGISAAIGTAVAPVVAFAQSNSGSALDKIQGSVDAVSTRGGVKSTQTGLPELVGNFINAALGLLGVILVCIVIYAGFLWMTAQGNDEKVKQAKKMITNAVIGMILIFAAYAITSFVVGALKTAITT